MAGKLQPRNPGCRVLIGTLPPFAGSVSKEASLGRHTRVRRKAETQTQSALGIAKPKSLPKAFLGRRTRVRRKTETQTQSVLGIATRISCTAATQTQNILETLDKTNASASLDPVATTGNIGGNLGASAALNPKRM